MSWTNLLFPVNANGTGRQHLAASERIENGRTLKDRKRPTALLRPELVHDGGSLLGSVPVVDRLQVLELGQHVRLGPGGLRFVKVGHFWVKVLDQFIAGVEHV